MTPQARVATVLVAVAVFTGACSGGSDGSLSSGSLETSTAAEVTSTGDTETPQETTTVSGYTVYTSTTRARTTSTIITTTPPTQLDQPLLPDDCTGLDTPLLPVQLTYLAEDKLISLDLLGEATCLIDLAAMRRSEEIAAEDEQADDSEDVVPVADPGHVEIVEWGAQADRVMFSDGRVVVLGGKGRGPGEAGPNNLAFSWPTGFNMIWLEDGTIKKSTSDARQLREIGDLGRYDEVVYHPDGLHLFLVANDELTSTIELSDNEGEAPTIVVLADDARISGLTLGSTGRSMVFTATHESGAIHLHSLNLEEAVEEVPLGTGEIERHLGPSDEVFITTVFEASQPLDHVVFDASGEQVAFSEGTCETGSTIELIDLVAGGYPLPIDPDLSARPVGFLTETQLAILVYDEDCVGGDLYLADTITGATDLIRKDVDSAAIRRSEPAARFTLVNVFVTGFA